MTLKDIEALPKDMLRATDIAEYIQTDPQDIRDQAHNDPSKLGFPVIVTGTRVKIPKEAFIKFIKGE